MWAVEQHSAQVMTLCVYVTILSITTEQYNDRDEFSITETGKSSTLQRCFKNKILEVDFSDTHIDTHTYIHTQSLSPDRRTHCMIYHECKTVRYIVAEVMNP